MKRYDVMVVGGGTAGVVAAIQAGRAGCRTLLVEKTALPGGTMVHARIAAPALFYAWKRPIIRGIGWELVSRCMAEDGRPLPDYRDPACAREHIRMNWSLFSLLCEEALQQADVQVCYHTMCAAVQQQADGWQVTLCTKTGLETVKTAVLIDCTGDANAVSMAGYPVERTQEVQPASYSCLVEGYDLDQVDLKALSAAYDREVAAGRLRYTDAGWDPTQFTPLWLKRHGYNGNHFTVTGPVSDSGEERSRLGIEARLHTLALYRFLKKQPGLEGLTFTDLSPECGVRESVRIVGETTVTAEDYRAGRLYDDAVCYAFYPIDLHTDGDTGLHNVFLDEGVVPTVPRGALVPIGSDNLLAAGRCIASDRVANSALRVQATCMATGQAAGALAALAVRQGVPAAEVPLPELYTLLEQHGAIVPKRKKECGR